MKLVKTASMLLKNTIVIILNLTPMREIAGPLKAGARVNTPPLVAKKIKEIVKIPRCSAAGRFIRITYNNQPGGTSENNFAWYVSSSGVEN